MMPMLTCLANLRAGSVLCLWKEAAAGALSELIVPVDPPRASTSVRSEPSGIKRRRAGTIVGDPSGSVPDNALEKTACAGICAIDAKDSDPLPRTRSGGVELLLDIITELFLRSLFAVCGLARRDAPRCALAALKSACAALSSCTMVSAEGRIWGTACQQRWMRSQTRS